MPRLVTVGQLAQLLGQSSIDIIKALMKRGIMANINQAVDFEAAAAVAADFGVQAREAPRLALEARPQALPAAPRPEDASRLHPRPPVVTILGHVDHGKTTLLDAIRQTEVAASEAGSITQHIGAYQVEYRGHKITFLDTPGHEAFTAMRARGARATDIAVLVVAADDGVMPQTLEAIDHARAAGVPIVVAINKIDKPDANPERVKQQLSDQGLLIEEWGGDVVCVPISAKRKQGLDDLLENILVVAEVAELKADPEERASGVVIEAKLDPSRGPMATALVQRGTIKVGDIVVAGEAWGRVKAMFDDKGKRMKRAEPSTPVEVLGLNGVPLAGEGLAVASHDRAARGLVQRRRAEREAARTLRGPSLDDLYARISAGQIKDLNVILKTDVQGSIEPIRSSLERLATEQLQVRVIHSATGNISESDVMLAIASKGIIIGFNSRPEPGARRLAEAEGVDIRFYDVIYNLVDDVHKALQGLLEPTYVEVIRGRGQVRSVFSARKGKVAGVYVTDGVLARGAQARVLRDGHRVHESSISSLRRFKEDVAEVATGFECGVGVEGFADFQEGDIIEAWAKERR